ncbi:hypothetical protein [Streptomyces sp. YIM S03343]
MIAEVIDAATAIGWALLAWVAVFALVVTAVGYATVTVLWLAGRWARKGAARAYAAVSRTNTPPCGSRVAGTPPEPADARTGPHDWKEAA